MQKSIQKPWLLPIEPIIQPEKAEKQKEQKT